MDQITVIQNNTTEPCSSRHNKTQQMNSVFKSQRTRSTTDRRRLLLLLIMSSTFFVVCFFGILHYHSINVNQEEDSTQQQSSSSPVQVDKRPRQLPLSFSIDECRQQKKYIGRREYGGWMICPLGLKPDSIVYSIGIGENVEFDQGMIRQFQLKALYGFDPTPKSISYVRRLRQMHREEVLSSRFKLHEYALTGDAHQTTTQFFLPKNREHVSGTMIRGVEHVETEPVTVKVLSLDRMMEMLDHDHIDLLKLDIEGSEFEIFEALLSESAPRPFDYCNQVLVEQHDRFFGEEGKQKLERMKQLFAQNGFELLHVEKDQEFTFIRQWPHSE